LTSSISLFSGSKQLSIPVKFCPTVISLYASSTRPSMMLDSLSSRLLGNPSKTIANFPIRLFGLTKPHLVKITSGDVGGVKKVEVPDADAAAATAEATATAVTICSGDTGGAAAAAAAPR